MDGEQLHDAVIREAAQFLDARDSFDHLYWEYCVKCNVFQDDWDMFNQYQGSKNSLRKFARHLKLNMKHLDKIEDDVNKDEWEIAEIDGHEEFRIKEM